MALVDLIDVSKSYETKRILCGVDFSINEGERVAVIGKNGGGKSTLLKIVAGTLEMDEGRRVASQNISIKMLSQAPKFKAGVTVKEAIESQLVELKRAKEEFLKVSQALSIDYENRALLEKHSKLSAFLDAHDAWSLEDKIERVMVEFKLKEYEDRSVDMLSGGEQRRVALAALLLQKPDLLLLDEPTNHLDVYMVEFLEEMLLSKRYTILFISHDRYFIDRIATRSIEIDECKIRHFKGGYSEYIVAKEKLLKDMQSSHEKLLKLLKSEEEWLNKGVKARLKRNQGRKERVMKLREEAKKNPSLIRKIKLELEREQKSFNQEDGVNRKKMLFEIEHLSKNLGDKVLIKDFSTRILQRDTIAIVGPNGVGKSTLLKILTGEMEPDSGVIKRGEFRIGYFDQHREMLNDEDDLIETFCPMGGDRVEVRGKSMHVYGYLKNFLFPKEDLTKKIGVLSGGEKNRVALALLFTKEYDLLILDEPTNDLDISTINILEEYLQSFNGAIILVSHDRYFVDKIAKKLFIFKGGGEIEESYLSYSEYLDIEKQISDIERLESTKNGASTKEKSDRKKNRQPKLSYNEKRAYEMLPGEIEELEQKIEEIEECIYERECYEKRGLVELTKELDALKRVLEEKVEAYLAIEEKLEAIQNQTSV